jgi:hypothetical protein
LEVLKIRLKLNNSFSEPIRLILSQLTEFTCFVESIGHAQKSTLSLYANFIAVCLGSRYL